MVSRFLSRKANELRPIALIPNYYSHTDGSCFAKFGNTQVICTATIDEKVPPFLRNTKSGWITAEYGMLPCSCLDRIDREAVRGKQSGRTMEIQRLLGRSLRSVVNLQILGERQIKIDCDVLQADGGTRTASITGAFIALRIAINKMIKQKKIAQDPILDHVVAISCGILNGEPLLDLDYKEDSSAEIDANFVMTQKDFIEIQICGEQRPYTEKEYRELINLASEARNAIILKQKQASE